MKTNNKFNLPTRLAFATVLFCAVSTFLNAPNDASAATNWSSTTIQKALFEDLYTCSTKYFNTEPIKAAQFSYLKNPFSNYDTKQIYLPSGIVGGDNIGEGKDSKQDSYQISCATLVYGKGDLGINNITTSGHTERFEGLIPLAWGKVDKKGADNSDIIPTNAASQPELAANLLYSMGYTYSAPRETTSNVNNCVSWVIKYTRSDNGSSHEQVLSTICFDSVNSDGKILSENFTIENSENKTTSGTFNTGLLELTNKNGGLKITVNTGETGVSQWICSPQYNKEECGYVESVQGETLESIGEYVTNSLNQRLFVAGQNYLGATPSEATRIKLRESGVEAIYQGIETKITAEGASVLERDNATLLSQADFIPRGSDSALIFIYNLKNGMASISDYSKTSVGTKESYSSLAFSQEEALTLYQGYFMNYYVGEVDCSKELSPGDEGYVRLYWEGSIKGCKETGASENSDFTVTGLNSSMHFVKTGMSYDDVVAALNALTAQKPENEEIAAGNAKLDDNIYSDDTSSTDAEETACQKGASNLGWIVCPIIQALSDAAGNLYEDVVSPALNMESELTNNDSVKSAWSTFRNIANTAFVILLLVVILSQVTGLGISNYGIKKILPKIIVTALLVNFSFIICQICLDASNIVGVNIRHLFESLETEVGSSITTTISSGESSTFNIDAGLVVGIAGGLGGLAAILIAGWVILIPVLITLITTVVSLLFAFVLLYVRKAIIILLVAISPLAFVCYALPNTKKLFDKWLKAMEGMVLLYPICGALIGAGDYAGHLLLSASSASNADSLIVLAALLVTVVPFFLVPSLLRGSFKALGSIGAAIGGFGLKTSKGIGGAAGKRLNTAFDRSKKAHRIADRRAEKDRKADNRYNRHVINSYGDKTDLSEAQQLRLAKAQKGDIANYNALKEAEAFGSTDFAKAAKMEAEQKAREARIGTISTKYTNLGKNDQFTQALTQAMANGDEETFTALYRLGSSKGFDVQIHDALSSDTASTYFNDTKNGANRRTYFYNEAEKGNSVTQKWYAKAARKAEQTGGSLSYMEYMKGSFDPNSSTNGSSFAKDVYDRGENSLVGQSEDTLQAITKSGAADQLSNACFDDTMIKMVTDPRADGKTLTAAEGLLSKRGGITTADAVNQQQLSKIRRASTLDAITSNGQNMAAVQKSVDAFKNPTTDATRRHVQSTNSNTMGWVRNH